MKDKENKLCSILIKRINKEVKMLRLVELSQVEQQQKPDLLTQLLTVGKEVITKAPITYQKGKYIYERTPEGKIIVRPATQLPEIPKTVPETVPKKAGMLGGLSPILLIGLAAVAILFLVLRKR